MKFSFDVLWSVGGSVEIEAESLEDAIKKAELASPCDVGNAIYVADSWHVEEPDEDEFVQEDMRQEDLQKR